MKLPAIAAGKNPILCGGVRFLRPPNDSFFTFNDKFGHLWLTVSMANAAEPRCLLRKSSKSGEEHNAL